MANPRYDSARNQFVYGGGAGDAAVAYAANGAISVRDGTHAITKTSLAAMTLAAPSGVDGMRILIVARTAFAHTVTITEGLGGRGAGFTVLTFAAVGDGIELQADNNHWVPVGAPYGVVIS